jgi:hypothetical protein
VFFLLNASFEKDLTRPDFYLWGAAKSAVYRNRLRTLNELKTAIFAYIRNISQADLQKLFAIKLNEFRTVRTLVNITSSTFYKCAVTLRTHCTLTPPPPPHILMARTGKTFDAFDISKACIHFPEGDRMILGTQTVCTVHC